LLNAFAEDKRPLTALQVPQARAWCQLEVLAQDAYNAIQSGEGGSKAWDRLLSTRRVQQPITLSLGMSPMATGQLAKELAGAIREKEAAELAKDLARDYGGKKK
jgi:hypothetical protein